MNPADTFAPIALHVLILLGVFILAFDLVTAIRRRRADPWRELARRKRPVPPQR